MAGIFKIKGRAVENHKKNKSQKTNNIQLTEIQKKTKGDRAHWNLAICDCDLFVICLLLFEFF